VCANAVIGVRVEDSECDDANDDYFGDDSSAATYAAAGLAGGVIGAAMWYYLSVRNRVVAPAIGERVFNGGYATPLYTSEGLAPVIYRSGSVDFKGGRLTSSRVVRGGLGLRHHGGHS